MNECTWQSCHEEAIHPQIGADGLSWAELCNEHDAELRASTDQMDPKKILRCWVLANGGAKAMSRKIPIKAIIEQLERVTSPSSHKRESTSQPERE